MSAAENTAVQLIGVLTSWLVVVTRPRIAARMTRAIANIRLGAPQTSSVADNGRSASPAPQSHLLTLSASRGFIGVFAVATSLGLAVVGAYMWAPTSSGTDSTEETLFDEIPAALAEHNGAASRVERSVFHSAALGREIAYTIYLPSGYDESTQNSYPTLYMLHGMGGHNTEWEGYGLLDAADKLIATGEIAPIIIVLPQGDQSYWVDWADGGPTWGLYLARDVVQHIDARFRTVANPSGRAVGGLSMGAHGALQVALR
jgi:hypothetical protein